MKQIPKSVENTHTHTYTKVCENKETDSPSGIYRMKLLGTCSLLKETPEKKKMGLLFFGSGTPTFWLGLLLFIQEFRGRRHRICWGKSHRSHNQNVVIE